MQDLRQERFRRVLLELKADLEAREDAAVQEGGPVELDQARIGRLSRMDALQAQAMAQEAMRRRQRQLIEIEGALRRIDAEEFGYCFVCGEEIDVRRLEVDPTSTRCVQCAEAH